MQIRPPVLAEYTCEKCGTVQIALAEAMAVTCGKGHSMRKTAILSDEVDKHRRP